LDLERVTSIDELNLRLWTYVESEYHNQPHSSLSGRTPLDVWQSDTDQIRWVDDHAQLEQAFYGEAERWVRNDSTIQWRSRIEASPYRARASRPVRQLLLSWRAPLLCEEGNMAPFDLLQGTSTHKIEAN